MCFFYSQDLSPKKAKGVDFAFWRGHIDRFNLGQEGYKFVFTKTTKGFIKESYWARPVVNRYNIKDEDESFVKFF